MHIAPRSCSARRVSFSTAITTALLTLSAVASAGTPDNPSNGAPPPGLAPAYPPGQGGEPPGQAKKGNGQPAGTITIDGGAAYTRDADVSLGFTAENADWIYVTNTAGCASGGAWQAMTASIPSWTLAELNTTATVYAMFRKGGNASNGGVRSACVSDTIIHDSLPPPVSITSGPASFTSQTSATFRVAVSDGTLACSLDGAAFTPCTSPVSYAGLAEGAHTFAVRATDAIGNVGTATHSWTVDTTPPVVAITGSPANPTRETSATFDFTAGDGAVTCSLDGGTFAPCSEHATYTGLAEGLHTFTVSAMDAAGNVGSATGTWRVDVTAPSLAITSAPASPTKETSATFVFTASDGTVACALDGAALAPCASPVVHADLAEGSHTFTVRATDAAGNAVTATRTWIVDVTPPSVAIGSGPANPTKEVSATFSFTAGDGAVTCSLDGAPFTSCNGTQTYAGLAEGLHTFTVSAMDAAGNVGNASATWAVDLTPPAITITAAPANPTSQAIANLSFTVSDGSIACSLDGAPFTSCASPIAHADLAEGPHTLSVQATDAAGNAATATSSWVVDVTPPAVSIVAGPADPTHQTTASFDFEAGDGQASCSLDGASFVSCTSGDAYADLAEGLHTFTVSSVDAAGNVASATYQWSVDLTPPGVTITSAPGAASNRSSGTITFEATDGSVACALDGVAFAPCASPSSYAGLGEGPHTFVVQATDAAGNVGSASVAWSIDLTPPAVAITAHPPELTNQTAAAFELTATEGAVLCSLDGGMFAPCDSPFGYSDLAEGPHVFTVSAMDAAGNAAAASFSWMIDLTPPAVAITFGPVNPTNETDAELQFTAGDGAVTCSLDGAAFAPCASPVSYADLIEGSHTFVVEARDAAGNVGSAAYAWIVDVTPPSVSITSGPIGPTNDTTATFLFEASDGALTCSLDGAPFVSCASPSFYQGLDERTHVFVVHATDLATNVGSARYTWPIDLTPPSVAITSGPSDPTHDTGATFTFTLSDGTARCSLDGAAFTSCSSPKAYANLAAGDHSFTVEARDAAGNTASASRSWTIEAAPPPNPSMRASATYVPSDGAAYATILVAPRSGGAPIGTGLRVEITSNDPGVVLGGTGTAACAVPSATCVRAFDSGSGGYVATARRTGASVTPVVFSATYTSAGVTTPIAETVSVTFDSSKFTGGPGCNLPCGATISTNTTITSAHAGGRNLYITGGTVTFDNTTPSQTFGDIFITGGSVTHLKGNSTTLFRIDVVAGSWNLLGGTVDTTEKGYGKTCFSDGSCQSGNGRYSFGANGAPSTSLTSNIDDTFGGSHGGMGNGNYQQVTSGAPNTHFGYAGPTYDDYRDPKYPGATNSTYSAFHGGGVTRVLTDSLCVLGGSARMVSTSPFNGAGGTVNLRCAGIVSAGWTGDISANGGNASGSSLPIGAGGGGRIALVSSGDAATITGAVSYPPVNITARVRAYGGAGSSGSSSVIGGGGAGTIYLKHSGLTYGDLIVANNSPNHYRNEGTTRLPSIAGTIGANANAGVTSVSVTIASTSFNATYYANEGAPLITSPALTQQTTASSGAAYNGVFAGIWLRPDINADGGSLFTSNLVKVTTNAVGTLTTEPTPAPVTQGSVFRSIDVLDHLDVTGNAIVETNGDIFVLSGNTGAHGSPTMTINGLVLFDTTAGRLGKIQYAMGQVDVVQSTQTMPPVAGGTLVADNVRITGGSIIVPAMIVTNSVLMTGGALTTNSLTAASYTQSAGTLAHYPAVYRTSPSPAVAQVNALAVNLTGAFTLSGGAIDVSTLGYPVAVDPQGTSQAVFSFGATAPSSATGAGNGKGGSHGGTCGNYLGATAGMAYDDYRNPKYPGGGGAAVPASGCLYCSREGPGGGVVRISTPATCTLASNAAIRANGYTWLGAGGSVYLGCGGFVTTGWTGAITANGGNADPGSSNVLGPGSAGGGGRIALVSSGGAASFSGTLAYPMPAPSAVLQARGGNGVSASYAEGGAGTVFLKHADVAYGQLIIANNNQTHYANSGYTQLLAIAGTLNGNVNAGATTIGVTITSTPLHGSAAFNGLLSGLWLRPDQNTSDVVVVSNNTFASSTLSNLTTTPAPAFAAGGTRFKSVDVLNRYDVGGGAVVQTQGDVQVVP